MTELTARDAHIRTYIKDGQTAEVSVNTSGVVEVSEELFDVLLRIAGYWESTPKPQGVDVLPLSTVGVVETDG